MRKFVLLAVVALGIGLMLTSCKSKEERFIADLQELTEKLEKADGMTEVLSITTKAEKTMRDKYGDNWNSMGPEGLNLTDEQQEQVKELQERMNVAVAQKSAAGMGDLMNAFDSAVNSVNSGVEALDDLIGSGDSNDSPKGE